LHLIETGFLQVELLFMPDAGNQGNKGGFGLLFDFTPCGADGGSELVENASQASRIPTRKTLLCKL
jgi:hypothetical protein